MSLFFVDGHAALCAGVCAFTLILFVMHDVYALYQLLTVDARNHYVRTCSLMHLYVLAQAFRLARDVGITLHGLVVTVLVMVLHFSIAEDLVTPEVLVRTLELHRIQLLLNFLLDRNEAWFLAHHGTLACLLGELVQTHLMEATLALLALPRFHENRLTQRAQQVLRHLVLPNHVLTVHGETHGLEVTSCGAHGGGPASRLVHGLGTQIGRPVGLL